MSAHAIAVLKEQMERTGVLLLAAQALLRDLGDSSMEDEREQIAKLLDMAIEENGNLTALNQLEAQP